MRLYKDRYLLAKYKLERDKNGKVTNEYLIAVGTTPKELGYKNYDRITHALMQADTAITYKLYAIDCLEQHNDIFAEEDKLFLELFKNKTKENIVDEYAKRHHRSRTNIYLKIKNGKLKYDKDFGEIYEKEF